MIYLVTGVTGSGKTELSKKLSEKLNCVYYDAGEYQPNENAETISRGGLLGEEDRKHWLYAVRAIIDREVSRNGTAVIEAAALRERYRKMLIQNRPEIKSVFIKVNEEEISSKASDKALLKEQFSELEEPRYGVIIEAGTPPDDAVAKILAV